MNFKAKFAVLALGTSLALAACGSNNVDADADGDGEVTAEEAAAAADQLSDSVKPQPGKYKSSMELVSIELPGAPPEMVEMMRGAMSSTEAEFCMTEEDAEEGFGEAMKQGQDDSCTISKMTVNGGKMDMAMSCNPEGAGEISIAVTGDVSPTSSEITMVTEGNFGPMGEGKMEMKVTQERIGECDAE